MDYSIQTVGDIVADNFDTAKVFNHYGIDFCCGGKANLIEACERAGADPAKVVEDLKKVMHKHDSSMPDFKDWPADLLVDHILKVYHQGIRRDVPQIKALLDKVVKAHGESHPSLFEVQELFEMSLMDLEHHLQKEETVLFPYITALADAERQMLPLPRFHCGSVSFPIEVMEMEHEAEGERYRRLEDLTGGYTAPEDACASYRLLMDQMREFNRALHEHIHLENNILFPKAVRLERELRTAVTHQEL